MMTVTSKFLGCPRAAAVNSAIDYTQGRPALIRAGCGEIPRAASSRWRFLTEPAVSSPKLRILV
jgi:hypothetical protein